MNAAWIKGLRETQKNLMESIESGYARLDMDSVDDFDCAPLTMGDLRKLAIVMDDYMGTRVAELKKKLAGENGADAAERGA